MIFHKQTKLIKTGLADLFNQVSVSKAKLINMLQEVDKSSSIINVLVNLFISSNQQTFRRLVSNF